MKVAPKPIDEAKRLAALHSLNILDSSAEQAFDDLSILASEICDCPIAFISLVDESRQWFKTKVGLNMDQGDRSISFCSHTILQNDLFVIEDTLKHPIFCDNPLVAEEPNIRFYAGMPLKVNGYNIGTFCIADVQPKKITVSQRTSIKRLARQAIVLIEAKHNIDRVASLNQMLAHETDHFRSLANLIPAAVAYWDKDLYCQFANPRYLHKIRKTQSEVIGYHYDDVISDKTAAVTKPYMAQVLQGKFCEFELPQEYLDENGQQRMGLCKYAPHFDQANELVGYFVLVTDITSIKNAEKDQKLFNRIFNQTASGIIICDHQHRIISTNQAFLDMHGYEQQELIGKMPHILASEPEKVDLLIKHLDEHGNFEGMVWGKTKSGDLIYCSINIDAVKNDLGKVSYFIATVIEQTESYETKSKLQIANEMLVRTGKMSGTGGWEYEIHSQKITWTDQVFVLHEVEDNVVPNFETAIDFYAAEARPVVKEAIEHCIATGEPFDLEVPFITAKHNHRWVRTNGELIRKDGAAYKLAGAFQDITDRKLKEVERIQDEINLRNTLVREVHHQIKNNLQGVSGILSQFALDNPNHATAFNEATAQLQSVAVIHGLHVEEMNTKIELGQLMSAITTNNEHIWQTKINISKEHWQQTFIAKNEAVPVALILNELATNAIKHQTRDDSVKITLAVHPQNKGQAQIKDKAIVTISNIGQDYGRLDRSQHKRNQSGLDLVESLMPKTGASLKWNITNDQIHVKFTLSYPTVKFK